MSERDWTVERAGNYAGTEVDGRWWKRARGPLFIKGNGHYRLEPDALVFQRLLLKEPVRVPYAAMTGARIGRVDRFTGSGSGAGARCEAAVTAESTTAPSSASMPPRRRCGVSTAAVAGISTPGGIQPAARSVTTTVVP